MNSETNIYTDYEIAGNMMEEHEKRDQQISVEVFYIFWNSFFLNSNKHLIVLYNALFEL